MIVHPIPPLTCGLAGAPSLDARVVAVPACLSGGARGRRIGGGGGGRAARDGFPRQIGRVSAYRQGRKKATEERERTSPGVARSAFVSDTYRRDVLVGGGEKKEVRCWGKKRNEGVWVRNKVWIVALWHGAQVPDEPESP